MRKGSIGVEVIKRISIESRKTRVSRDYGLNGVVRIAEKSKNEKKDWAFCQGALPGAIGLNGAVRIARENKGEP
jgi:hypothetical protein